MERILVLGCPGSGKSTLSNLLGEKLSLPVVHLDRLWWTPGWVEHSEQEFDALLAEELRKDRWVIDGNFARTLPVRLPACDTVLFLDHSRPVCLWSILKRTAANLGHSRADMPEGCGKDVHVFYSRRECAAFMAKL